MSESFRYVIARPWTAQESDRGGLCIYMIHGGELHEGTMESAQAQLGYVKFMEREYRGDQYRIYPVTIGDPL